jgi:hypothetical protein
MIVKEQEKAEEHRRKQQELAWNILPRRQSSRIAISKIKTQSSHDSEVRFVASALACVWCKHLMHCFDMCGFQMDDESGDDEFGTRRSSRSRGADADESAGTKQQLAIDRYD